MATWPIFHRLLRILNDNKNTVEDLKFDTEIAFPLIQSKVENILYLSHYVVKIKLSNP